MRNRRTPAVRRRRIILDDSEALGRNSNSIPEELSFNPPKKFATEESKDEESKVQSLASNCSKHGKCCKVATRKSNRFKLRKTVESNR